MAREGDKGARGSEKRKVSSSRIAASDSAIGTRLIIGIGASAGGLGAFTSFLSNMPSDSGMAFILVQHLSPDHKSILTDLLAKTTSMPVMEAEDGMQIEANRVFVIPPDSTLTIKDRRISISRPAPPRERRRPIDSFFLSLAEDQGEDAVCIVLSGTGTDGSLGLKTVKESGGLTIAQAESDHTAMSGMPRSAVLTGLVDYILPVEEMPARLLAYRDHLRNVAGHKDGDGVREDAWEHLTAITAMLRIKTDHDFSRYKEATVARRVQRRMQVLQIVQVPVYLERLRDDAQEAEALFRELLIGVTRFFRDPDAFESLRTTALAKIVEAKGPDDTIRIWVPACSTGEEVYSIAILIKEEMERQNRSSKIQIFGTDLDETAVTFGRTGRYRKTSGLSSERLRRWFVDDGDETFPNRSIRESCIFSVHSVIKDPPFSKLDLISCRNLLIYFNHELQDGLLETFRYALKPGGYLFLGPSEGVGRQPESYVSLDKKHRIFQRADAPRGLPGSVPTVSAQQSKRFAAPAQLDDPIERSARRALEKYSPVYVIIDRAHHILRFSGGEFGRYLEPSAGAASLDLLNNLRRSLRPTVRAALLSAISTQAAVNDDAVFEADGKTHAVTIAIEPLAERGAEASAFLVTFIEGRMKPADSGEQGLGPGEQIDSLGALRELSATKAQLQATVEDLETANEEMRSISEEYQSVNEELQSTNEELETSKEEMQSINEELQTINAEMFAKNEALTVLNSDFKNLLDSTQIATIFLDDEFCIKSFTPGMTEIFRLRESDRGRPISDIANLIDYPDLHRDFLKVLRDLSAIEREISLKSLEVTFLMRIRPYRTVENVINGVVITFVDVSARKKVDLALQASEERFSAIVNQATVGVAETDLEGRFVLTNARYGDIVHRSEDELKRLRQHDLIHENDSQRAEQSFQRLIEDGIPFQIELRYLHPDGTPIWVHNSVSLLVQRGGDAPRILTVTQEIGERKRAEERNTLLLGELDHRVKNILAVISSVVTQTLKTSDSPGAFAVDIEGRIAAIARAHGRLTDNGRGAVSLGELVSTELAPYNRTNTNIKIEGPPVEFTPKAGLALAMAIHELASNAAKYGALSKPAGVLSASWQIEKGSSGLLNFSWIETGGPSITEQPSRRGFGSTLIERTLALEFDATVKREFLLSGLKCSIAMPLTPEVIYVSTSRS
ncbi:two-component system CheB/CheR fusion protein [Nitrobacter vulgaris]|uniref:chemotaxis protein CheB n=1 Tax=Nitrobacter vulgaris TaxID=29421 RepID=UPI002861F0AF|nr:chemotaxis protein CheB [Nitrobacter vulgaris]MDR6305326.1 two-component system CheB/CheR fusion protein [Nitrobacter vulgaris]